MSCDALDNLIEIKDAQRIVLEHARPLPAVSMELLQSLHRTLAAPIICSDDFPPFDRSLMDGYAVRAEDTHGAPRKLVLLGSVAAGHAPTITIGRNEAMRINTGARMPVGADAVVRQEDVDRQDDSGITTRVSVHAGQFVSARGSFRRKGTQAIPAGTTMTSAEMGAAASCGAARVSVHRQPSVAVLITGDEIVPIESDPGEAGIRDSNRYLLEACIRESAAVPVSLGSVRDELDEICRAVQRGLACDVICITGGVSVGDHDYVPKALERIGAKKLMHRVAIKPGRPILFAIAPEGKLVFALPGNPISAMVGFALLVGPALSKLSGNASEPPKPLGARLRDSLKPTERRQSYLPARLLQADDGRLDVHPLIWHGSGDVFGTVGANCLIVRSPRSPAAVDGDTVEVLLLGAFGPPSLTTSRVR